jgi:arabinogalactan endo-1,4-beta-galactosidase
LRFFYTKAPEGFPFANACKGDWERLGEYLNAGIKAIRDAGAASNPQPKILLHVADPKNIKWWFDSITTKGRVRDFEAIGFSYYPLWHRAVTLDSISYHIALWKNRFKKEVMVLETAYPWTLEGADSYRNSFGSQQPLPGFAFTQDGQLEFLKALTHEIKKGGGIGLIYWEPAWITSSMKDLWGTGSSWENATLFDFQGNPTKGMGFMKEN